MADTKVTDLTALTGANAASTDVVPIVDVSDNTMAASGTTKKITVAELAKAVGDAGRLTLGAFGPTTDPTAPTTGVVIFGRDMARNLPAYIGPSGISSRLQTFFGSNNISFFKPSGNSTTVTSNGVVVTANATAATAANWAITNLFTQSKRVSYPSAATAGSGGGLREAVLKHSLGGGVAGAGGFHLCVRFGFATIPATKRWFVGMVATTGVIANADPSAQVNVIGVGQDLADTTIQFMSNDGSGTATKSVGSSSLTGVAINELYEFNLFVPPNTTNLAKMSFGRVGGTYSDVTFTTDLPASTTGLAWQLWANNGSTAAIIDMHIVGVYIETDN